MPHLFGHQDPGPGQRRTGFGLFGQQDEDEEERRRREAGIAPGLPSNLLQNPAAQQFLLSAGQGLVGGQGISQAIGTGAAGFAQSRIQTRADERAAATAKQEADRKRVLDFVARQPLQNFDPENQKKIVNAVRTGDASEIEGLLTKAEEQDSVKMTMKTLFNPVTQRDEVFFTNPSGGIFQRDVASGRLQQFQGPRLEKAKTKAQEVNVDVNVTDGTEALTKPNKSFIQKEAIKTEKNLRELRQLGKDFVPEDLTLKGKVKGTIGHFLDIADLPNFGKLKDFQANRNLFTSGVNRFFSRYRIEVTGAQAAIAELDLLRKETLSTDLGPTEFTLLFNQFLDKAEEGLEQHRKLLREGVEVAPGVKVPEVVAPESVPRLGEGQRAFLTTPRGQDLMRRLRAGEQDFTDEELRLMRANLPGGGL